MMRITKAGLADLPALAELFNAYRVFYRKEADIEGALSFLEERISRNESEIFIARNQDEMVGFVQLYPLFSSGRMKRLWLLNDLFVKEECRKQGIAAALIERSKELCISTGACALTLETEKSNVPGNGLYPKAGFVLDTLHSFYSWNV